MATYLSHITLPGNPVADDHAARKKYVDDGIATLQATLGTAAFVNTGTTANTVPVLDSTGKLAVSTIPQIALLDYRVVTNQAARLALTTAQIQAHDIVSQSDDGSMWWLSQTPASTASNWVQVVLPQGLALGNIAGAALGTAGIAGVALTAARSDHVHPYAVPDWNAASGTVGFINNKPTVPAAANNATITFQRNGQVFTGNTFTVNQASAATINFPAPDWNAASGTVGFINNKPDLAGVIGFRGTVTGNGTNTDLTVTHNLNSQEVAVTAFRNTSPPVPVEIRYTPNTASQVTLHFAVAPASSETFIVKVKT
jgi:hypothetical protein